MKFVLVALVALLMAVPVFGCWQWGGRAEARRALLEARSEARRASMEAQREMRQARTEVRQEMNRAHQEMRRAAMEAARRHGSCS
jgi:hypothetical protein